MATNDGAPADKRPRHELEALVSSLLHRRTSRDIYSVEARERRTLGQRTADGLTRLAGSWHFIIGFLVILAVWMAVNAWAGLHHWDPYPFILLNLLLSCIAAIQAPIILMSQNREEARDRIRAAADYEVNLKAEVLLEHLTHEMEALKALLAAENRQAGA